MKRRDFLRTSAALSVAPSLLSATSTATLLAKKKRVALLGCGWYGKNDLLRLLQVADVEVVGLCDVDERMLTETLNLLKERQPTAKPPAVYRDYQKLLTEEKPDLVLIASPDHQHALMAIAAMRAGADLYLQKPVSLDVLEGEAVLATARKLGSTVQIGTQRRSTPHLLEMKKQVLDSGLIGKIGHVEMCCYYHMRFGGNPPVKEVPDHFDYEAWTGPSPLIPYTGLPHRRWRARQEYGNGIVGDMCVHMFDTARWLLGLGWPERIHSVGGIRYGEGETWANITDTQSATFSYPGLDCVWQHRTWGPSVDPDYPWALFLYGENGTLKMDTRKWSYTPNKGRGANKVAVLNGELENRPLAGETLYEREKFPEDLDEKDIELHVASATRAHLLDLVEAIDENRRPVADVEEGHISTASCILANISCDLGGRVLSYDPERHLVIGDEEATKLLKRDYREGYKHPYLV